MSVGWDDIAKFAVLMWTWVSLLVLADICGRILAWDDWEDK